MKYRGLYCFTTNIIGIPHLIAFSTSQNISEWKNITLVCNGTGNPIPSIIWLKDGNIINNLTSDYTLSNQRKMLTIRNASLHDEGSYQCLLKNTVGQITSPATMITIFSKKIIHFVMLIVLYICSVYVI